MPVKIRDGDFVVALHSGDRYEVLQVAKISAHFIFAKSGERLAQERIVFSSKDSIAANKLWGDLTTSAAQFAADRRALAQAKIDRDNALIAAATGRS